MNNSENIVNDLIEISRLKSVLGYRDSRSTLSWCDANNIPVILLGRKNYILKSTWDQFLNQIVNHNQANKSSLADHNIRLAGKKSQIQPISHSFTIKNNSNSSLESLVSKYKSKLND
jgi:hypothetical protein